jgi:hypothetical protein
MNTVGVLEFPISFSNCQNFPFQTVKISLSKLSKFPFQNCQNFPLNTVKISLSKLSKFPFPNCQNFPLNTVKIFFFKLSKLKGTETLINFFFDRLETIEFPAKNRKSRSPTVHPQKNIKFHNL